MEARQVEAGWYWWDFAQATELAAWTAFCKLHSGVVINRSSWQTQERTAVLFEVRSPVAWTLGGLPTKAPHGINTRLQDMASAPNPSPGFVAMVEELTGKAFGVFKATGRAVSDTAHTTSTAVKVLVWGAGAILLYNLFQNTRAESDDG